jgi:hypothetical protein
MSDEIPPVHDFSRVDAFVAARRRTAFLHAVWRPMLAGAAGAALVIGAVWVTLPKISYREIVVDHVVPRDVTVDHVVPRDVTVNNLIPHDVPIDIPRIVTASPAPRTPEERAFVGTEGWKDAVIRGRILRPDRNGFILATDDGEQGFYPARIGADGKPEPNPGVKDVVDAFMDDLGYCRKLPIGTFECVALHAGQEVFIEQTPIERPRRATEGPHALAETKTVAKGEQA